MSHSELDSAVQDLYAGAREDFIARRKELAKTARDGGDAEVAARIEKLVKPSIAAWLANRLARSDGKAVRALTELGDALRRAHEELDGSEIRSLTQARTERIRELVGLVRTHSEQALSESVLRELEEIFTKAVADPDVGAALVSGTVTSAKAFAPSSGWPSLPVGERPAAPSRPASRAKPQRREGEDAEHARRRERAQQQLEEARASVKEAEAARADDDRSLADAESAAEEAAAEVSRLSEELDAAESREKRARGLVAMARRSVKEAEKRAAQAWRQVQQAEARLADLEE